MTKIDGMPLFLFVTQQEKNRKKKAILLSNRRKRKKLLAVVITHIALVLLLRRVEHVEDAGAAADGVGDGVVVEGVGVEHLEPPAAAGHLLLLLLLLPTTTTAAVVCGGVDGVAAAEEAVDERGAQRARRVHDADGLAGPRGRRLHGTWTHGFFSPFLCAGGCVLNEEESRRVPEMKEAKSRSGLN
jgi:hypothetical protein